MENEKCEMEKHKPFGRVSRRQRFRKPRWNPGSRRQRFGEMENGKCEYEVGGWMSHWWHDWRMEISSCVCAFRNRSFWARANLDVGLGLSSVREETLRGE